MLAGVIIGVANEFMTEPNWTYHMRFYIWRDISPFTILGWGPMFTMLVGFSDCLYHKLFHDWPKRDWRVVLTDLIVGVPMLLGGELFGLNVLKNWEYNAILGWTTMIPVINYPLEGVMVMIFFIIAVPAVVRYWTDSWAKA